MAPASARRRENGCARKWDDRREQRSAEGDREARRLFALVFSFPPATSVLQQGAEFSRGSSGSFGKPNPECQFHDAFSSFCDVNFDVEGQLHVLRHPFFAPFSPFTRATTPFRFLLQFRSTLMVLLCIRVPLLHRVPTDRPHKTKQRITHKPKANGQEYQRG